MKKYLIAFTLIELLVVIAIIGILSGLIVVAMGGMTNSANIAKNQVFSNSLRNALMLNLVSEWKFDDLSTATNGATIKDSWSAGNNNGTLYTSDAFDKLRTGNNCASGKCLNFDGVDDYIDAGNSNYSALTNTVTLGFWINLSGNQSGFDYSAANIISKHSTVDAYGWGFGVNWHSAAESYRRRVYFTYLDSTYSEFGWRSNTQLSYGQWYYVVVTIDNPNRKIYINGVLDRSDSITMPTNWASNSYSLFIGRDTSQYYNGLIDEVRIFNAAMPTSEIKEQYYAGLNNLLASGSISNGEYQSRLLTISKK